MGTSFDAEWAEIKAHASARMQLASATPDGGGGGDLRSSKQAWSQAAEGVGGTQRTMKTATDMLRDGQQGAGGGDAGVDGLASTAAQARVLRSWETRLDLIARESTELQGKLEKAGSDHYRNDDEVRGAFQEQQTTPREPQPHGR